MIEITNQRGEVMELYPDETISVERNNPLFNDADKLLQDITYTAQAPLSPRNKRFFGGGHLIESSHDVYELPVQVTVSGTPFFAGKVNYKISKGKFSFTLLINFGSLASKVKNTRLPEIRTNDWKDIASFPAFHALMLDTIVNPDKHPYAFFPVSNLTTETPTYNHFVNHYDFDKQAFDLERPGIWPDEQTFFAAASPFYKIGYILKVIFGYLGFTASGGFFSDADLNKLYIYTRRSIETAPANGYRILPCMSYMPNITVGEFFKQLRERLHLSLNFNVQQGTVEVESFKTVLNAQVTDLSKWIESVEEVEVPQKKGYTVSYNQDDQDALYALFNRHRMIVGDGAEPVVLNCTTTSYGMASAGLRKYPAVDQPILSNIYPGDHFPYQDELDPTSRNNWPLRLIQLNGIKPVYEGRNWPEAEPFLFTSDDVKWYRSLNDSKQLKLIASMPPSVVGSLNPTGLFSFLTRQGTYIECLAKKISYDLADNKGLIKVKFEAVTIRYEEATSVQFVEAAPSSDEVDTFNYFLAFKAHFPSTLGKVEIEMTSTTPGITITVPPIANTSDEAGAGGDTVWARARALSGIPLKYENILGKRIKLKVKPKYLEAYGVKHYFTLVDGRWILDMDGIGLVDRTAMWLVF